MKKQKVKAVAEGVPVSETALLQRINRALRGKTLHRARGKHTAPALGLYYVRTSEVVTDKNVDIDALGRELGVLKPFESLVKNGAQ
jgi:hypothetical protein